MAKLSDLATNDKLKVLLYGESGAGKTTFAASAPGPVFFFDFDGNISSAKKYLEVTNPGKIGEIDYEHLPLSRTQNPYGRFQALLKGLEDLAANGDFKFKTVVLDSLTLYSDALMADVMRTNPGTKRFNPDVPVMQDYLVNAIKFKQDIARILSLPCNVICTGHITQEKDEITGEIRVRPLLSGKLADHLPRIFFEVWRAYVDAKDGKHKAQTRSDGRFVCRTEIPRIPSSVDLEFDSIFKYLSQPVNKKEEVKA